MNRLTRKTINFYKENKAIFAKIYALFLIVAVVLSLISEKLSVKVNNVFTSAAQGITESMSFKNFFTQELISTMKNELPLLFIVAAIFALAKFIYSCMIISKIAENDGRLPEKPRFPSYFALFTTFILCELMRSFGFLLFVIPGIILSFFLLMVPCVLVMENKANFVSFDRSFSIMKKDIMNVIYAVLAICAVYFGIQLAFSLILSLIQTLLNGIMNVLSFSVAVSVSDNIFTFLEVFVSSALYAIFAILMQSMLYIHYTEQVNETNSVNQNAFEEKKYTLDDYYRGKEEHDDDEK